MIGVFYVVRNFLQKNRTKEHVYPKWLQKNSNLQINQ